MIKSVAVISLIVLGIGLYLQFGNQTAIVRDGKIIQLKSGSVKGTISESRDGRDYYAWYKIPFAKPPIGKLRFADPEPAEPWNDIIDGRTIGPECSQVSLFEFSLFPKAVTGSEDCLHVNVFAPAKLHDDIVSGKKPKVPVIVCIHGGGYMSGSARFFGSSAHFMDEDVVTVSVQYRVDVLGFLTTGDKVARGNQGLKDVSLALKWVRDNIDSFGGDKNQVLIYGTSAGAAAVHQQMLSPMSKDLFHKAFAQSGAASNPWGFIPMETALNMTKEVAEQFKCPTSDNQLLIDCLRNVPVEDLVQTRVGVIKNWLLIVPKTYHLAFAPVIETVKDDKAFLTEHPLKVVSEGRAHRVPMFIGMTADEGFFVAYAFVRNPGDMDKFEDSWTAAIKVFFGIENQNLEEIATKIRTFYFPKDQKLSYEEKLAAYMDMFGDASFTFDIAETVEHQRKYSPVYYYVHNRTTSSTMGRLMFSIGHEYPVIIEVARLLFNWLVKETILGIKPPLTGVPHAMDFVYYIGLFGSVIGKDDLRDYQYSKDLVKMLVQFAADGSQMEFRGTKLQPTAPNGPITLTEFRGEGVISTPQPFEQRIKFLRSLNIRQFI